MNVRTLIQVSACAIGMVTLAGCTTHSHGTYCETGYAYHDDGRPYSSHAYPFYDYGYWHYQGYSYTGIGTRPRDSVRHGDRHDYRGDDRNDRPGNSARPAPQPPSLREEVARERGDARRQSSPAPSRGDDRSRAAPPRQNGHGPVTEPPSLRRNDSDRPNNPRGGR